MSLNVGSLIEKRAEAPDPKTGEIKKRPYYSGRIELATFPHLSGEVAIVPRDKPSPKSPGWTVKRRAGSGWAEIGTAWDAEMRVGGTMLNIYLYPPGSRERLNLKAWPDPDAPDSDADEPAYRVTFDIRGDRPAGAPAATAGVGDDRVPW